MHLPIPASEQIRAAHHAICTDILNAHRRCAPQAELNALEDRKQAILAVDDQIKNVLGHFRAARALREISSAPNPDAVAHREKFMTEAVSEDAKAYATLRDIYAVLNLPTQ
jgi:hypothetical protein